MSRSASPAATESAAARARSAVAAAVSARLTTPTGQIDLLGGHVALPDGRFVVFVSPGGTVASAIARTVRPRRGSCSSTSRRWRSVYASGRASRSPAR